MAKYNHIGPKKTYGKTLQHKKSRLNKLSKGIVDN